MSRTKHKPKSAFDARASAEMDRHLATPEWTTREKLALSCRMLAREEHGSALAGQVTAVGLILYLRCLRIGGQSLHLEDG